MKTTPKEQSHPALPVWAINAAIMANMHSHSIAKPCARCSNVAGIIASHAPDHSGRLRAMCGKLRLAINPLLVELPEQSQVRQRVIELQDEACELLAEPIPPDPHARLLDQNEMLRKALETIVRLNDELRKPGVPVARAANRMADAARAALEQTEKV